MSVAAHRIRLAGKWALQPIGSDWVIARSFHHPTGLLASTRVRLFLVSPPQTTIAQVQLNGAALSTTQPTGGTWISPIDLELLRPFNQIEVTLHRHADSTDPPGPTLVPNPTSTFLNEAWLELQDEPPAS